MSKTKADYGMDAPGVIRNLFLVSAVALAIAWLFPVLGIPDPHLLVGSVNFIFPWRGTMGPGLGCFAAGMLMVYYSKAGKFTLRDRILGMVSWRGDELVLDVGTGRGLLMIGAAKKLGAGRAVGIDIWSTKDLSGNTRENTLRNAELEGVREKVEVKSEDATAMKFADDTFDIILSNACLHNIPSKQRREKACREIVRVLKPGGKALISDFIHTGDYLNAFRFAGALVKRSGSYLLMMKIVAVQK